VANCALPSIGNAELTRDSPETPVGSDVCFDYMISLSFLYFWRIYEMDFPERSDMKAPGDSDFPFGAFVMLVIVCIHGILKLPA
jgi:hypothetical protein